MGKTTKTDLYAHSFLRGFFSGDRFSPGPLRPPRSSRRGQPGPLRPPGKGTAGCHDAPLLKKEVYLEKSGFPQNALKKVGIWSRERTKGTKGNTK